ncbi:hypothetical protein DUNSADRAFT_9658 [Dunaliella salina]|uniref:Encoded protein n=1 Tax=Dunaliella salina TaxID=3046 RepID=A0ABQ7GH25_DUNSA|nr:hypothetical protein DUNSADRAFT_9658 [Dunaliella salina]|eukprot:KAF5833910.1 hypothetical protein DUNSADRAFT_9658 [Dunaliella salina]
MVIGYIAVHATTRGILEESNPGPLRGCSRPRIQQQLPSPNLRNLTQPWVGTTTCYVGCLQNYNACIDSADPSDTHRHSCSNQAPPTKHSMYILGTQGLLSTPIPPHPCRHGAIHASKAWVECACSSNQCHIITAHHPHSNTHSNLFSKSSNVRKKCTNAPHWMGTSEHRSQGLQKH